EDIAGRLIDRHGARAGQLIGLLPGMEAQGREFGKLGLGHRNYCALQPPSIGMAVPVMVSAAGLHRNSTSPANCSTVTKECIACFSATISLASCSTGLPEALARAWICFSTSGVLTQPGQKALQVMPSLAVSSAVTLVKPMMPCLAET